jgi:acetyl esterase/lipase
VLLYPVLDSRMGTESYMANKSVPILTPEAMAGYWTQYVPDPAQRTDPYASPASAHSLAGLPRAFVATAEFDPLRDEGCEYAARLRRSGVDVVEVDYPGQVHGFLALDADFVDSRDLVRRVAHTIRDLPDR